MTDFQAAVIAAAIIKSGNMHYLDTERNNYATILKEVLDVMKAKKYS